MHKLIFLVCFFAFLFIAQRSANQIKMQIGFRQTGGRELFHVGLSSKKIFSHTLNMCTIFCLTRVLLMQFKSTSNEIFFCHVKRFFFLKRMSTTGTPLHFSEKTHTIFLGGIRWYMVNFAFCTCYKFVLFDFSTLIYSILL